MSLPRSSRFKPGKPLARRTALVSAGAPKRRKRLNPVSATNTRWNAPGRARPDEPLATWCQVAIPGVCTGRAEVRHHIIRRGPGSSDEAWNTLDLDDACHGYIHRNITWAKTRGYLRSRPA